MELQLKSSEVDTKGVEVFDHLVFSGGEIDKCGNVAKFIWDYSKSETVKQYIKRRLVQCFQEKYSFLHIHDADLENQDLFRVYCNRAVKKLDISKDIPVFSEMAGRYIDEGMTSLHYDRLYTLFQSVRAALAVDGDIVELGVFQGGSLKFISEVVDTFGGEKRLLGFDTFKGHIVTTDYDGHFHKVGMFNADGIKAVSGYINDSRVRLVEGDASETFANYARESLGISFAHIDMDVYQPTADALPLAFELLAPRGIIVLDDYGFISCPGVKRATDEFLKRVAVTSFHLMTGQMIIIK